MGRSPSVTSEETHDLFFRTSSQGGTHDLFCRAPFVVRICPVLIAIFGCLQYALFISVIHNVMLYMRNYLLCSTISSILVQRPYMFPVKPGVGNTPSLFSHCDVQLYNLMFKHKLRSMQFQQCTMNDHICLLLSLL